MNPVQRLLAIHAIAMTTFREAIRNRILYVMALFAAGLILFSAVLSNLTLGFQVRIVTDLSLSAASLVGTTIAVLLGVTSVARELERRTYFPVLARPISRADFVIGKWLGVTATTWLIEAAMMALATVMIAAYTHEGSFQYAAGPYVTTLLLTLVRLAVIAAIAVGTSTLASSTVATMATVTVLLAGYTTDEVRWFLRGNESPLAPYVGTALYHALPDLAALDALPRLLYGDPLGLEVVWAPVLYSLAWTAVLLGGSSLVFSRRDLT